MLFHTGENGTGERRGWVPTARVRFPVKEMSSPPLKERKAVMAKVLAESIERRARHKLQVRKHRAREVEARKNGETEK